MELLALIQAWGAPATGGAVVMLLWRLNRTLDAQRAETRELFHTLDKRVTVIESKGG